MQNIYNPKFITGEHCGEIITVTRSEWARLKGIPKSSFNTLCKKNFHLKDQDLLDRIDEIRSKKKGGIRNLESSGQIRQETQRIAEEAPAFATHIAWYNR